jgi:hypothetical protein
MILKGAKFLFAFATKPGKQNQNGTIKKRQKLLLCRIGFVVVFPLFPFSEVKVACGVALLFVVRRALSVWRR